LKTCFQANILGSSTEETKSYTTKATIHQKHKDTIPHKINRKQTKVGFGHVLYHLPPGNGDDTVISRDVGYTRQFPVNTELSFSHYSRVEVSQYVSHSHRAAEVLLCVCGRITMDHISLMWTVL